MKGYRKLRIKPSIAEITARQQKVLRWPFESILSAADNPVKIASLPSDGPHEGTKLTLEDIARAFGKEVPHGS